MNAPLDCLSFVCRAKDGTMIIWSESQSSTTEHEQGRSRADEMMAYCRQGGCGNVVLAVMSHLHRMTKHGPMERAFVNRIVELGVRGLARTTR